MPRNFSITCGSALHAEKCRNYISFIRLWMVLTIYWSFIDPVQLCCISNLSKVGAENSPHPSARRQNLARFNTLPPTFLIISFYEDCFPTRIYHFYGVKMMDKLFSVPSLPTEIGVIHKTVDVVACEVVMLLWGCTEVIR